MNNIKHYAGSIIGIVSFMALYGYMYYMTVKYQIGITGGYGY